jgi:hypothetical protein
VTRRSAAQVDLEERILHWEARAARACRDHDPAAEWLAEIELWNLYEERAALPPQRKPVEP